MLLPSTNLIRELQQKALTGVDLGIKTVILNAYAYFGRIPNRQLEFDGVLSFYILRGTFTGGFGTSLVSVRYTVDGRDGGINFSRILCCASKL